MSPFASSVLRRHLVVLLMLLSAPVARAALGQSLDACAADGALQGPPQRVAAGVQLQRVLAPGGVRLAEYANADGVVFGVAWAGPVLPDFGRLLGSRAQVLRAQASAPSPDLHTLVRSGDDVELRLSGQLRAFSGRAWAPSLRPQQFAADLVQP